jgi:hypothetical protein
MVFSINRPLDSYVPEMRLEISDGFEDCEDHRISCVLVAREMLTVLMEGSGLGHTVLGVRWYYHIQGSTAPYYPG